MITLTDDCVGLSELVDSLARRNHEASVLLLEDAVFLADVGKQGACSLKDFETAVYACSQHLNERGITDRLAIDVEVVDYPEIIDLIMERHDRVISL